jgi:uncharacterized membrane protein
MTRLTDQQLDTAIGIVLRIGVMAAAALVAAGGVMYLVGHAASAPSYSVFHGAPPGLTSMRAIIRGAATLNPLFVVQFGLIVLMATPVARVIACAVGFGWQRDWKYVVISLIVLGLLLVGLIGYSG